MRVVSVEPGSPAARAGVREGDVIVGIDGAAIDSVDALHQTLDESRIHRDCVLKLLRGHASPQADVRDGAPERAARLIERRFPARGRLGCRLAAVDRKLLGPGCPPIDRRADRSRATMREVSANSRS